MITLVLAPAAFVSSYCVGRWFAHRQYERELRNRRGIAQMNTFGKSLFDL